MQHKQVRFYNEDLLKFINATKPKTICITNINSLGRIMTMISLRGHVILKTRGGRECGGIYYTFIR